MKFMKLIVMFDLPTGNERERKSYALFRKALVSEGFTMIQFSVYGKTIMGEHECEAEIERVRKYLPKAGSVTAFTMTDRQYAARHILIAPFDEQPEFDLSEQMTLSF